MQTWPLLDIREAVADAEKNLADVLYYVHTLQGDTEGHLPPDATMFLVNVTAIVALLATVFPPALAQAIRAEQTDFDAEAERWEPADS